MLVLCRLLALGRGNSRGSRHDLGALGLVTGSGVTGRGGRGRSRLHLVTCSTRRHRSVCRSLVTRTSGSLNRRGGAGRGTCAARTRQFRLGGGSAGGRIGSRLPRAAGLTRCGGGHARGPLGIRHRGTSSPLGIRFRGTSGLLGSRLGRAGRLAGGRSRRLITNLVALAGADNRAAQGNEGKQQEGSNDTFRICHGLSVLAIGTVVPGGWQLTG